MHAPAIDPDAHARGDPLGAAALRALGEPRPGDDQVPRLLASTHPDCEALVRACAAPDWLRPQQLNAGRDIQMTFAPLVGLVFICSSLPQVYAMPDIAAVLSRSGRLHDDVPRRLGETAQVYTHLARSDALLPGGEGWRALLRVRLLHALVERRLGDGPPRVHQQGMAWTLSAHSQVMREGLRSLGVPLTPEASAAHQHYWRWVGAMLGVEPALQCTGLRQEDRLHAALLAQVAPDAAGRSLTRALLHSMARTPPFFLPEVALEALSCRLLPTALSEQLALRADPTWSGRWQRASALLAWSWRRRPGGALFSRAARAGGTAFAEVAARALAGGQQAGQRAQDEAARCPFH